MQLCSLYLCFMKKHHTFVSERPGHGEFGKKSKRNKVLKSELGGLIGMATTGKDGLMSKNQVCRGLGKDNNMHCCLKFEIKSFGECVNGFIYVADTNGVTSTIAVSATIWNTTRVYCKLINGGNEYIQSISYKKEADSILIFIKISQYANILFAPMTQQYSSSLEAVASIPSDAININF